MTSLSDLGVSGGKWVVANCGNYPSERNCKLVLMAPADQREDLLDAAVAHAVKHHGHQESPQLRRDIGGLLEVIDA